MQTDVEISLSIVSHGQMELVHKLLLDISKHCAEERLEVILTLNLKDEVVADLDKLGFSVQVLRNPLPMGFGANHNQAFRRANGEYFCVLNPDVRLHANPFPVLRAALADPQIGVVAPLVMDIAGRQEDSARRFPTPAAIVRRLLTGKHQAMYAQQEATYRPDWIGGMFLLFTRAVYQDLHGFDTRYFLYYEDVDLCARLALAGWQRQICPAARVVHAAQRSSHKSLSYLRWHLASMLRFFTSATFLRLWRRGLL